MVNLNFFKLLRIGGWINTLNIKLFIKLSSILTNPDILEIGTHHGRSIIPIIKSNKNTNNTFLIDIFSNQKLNVSKSGRGDKKILISNLEKFNIDLNKVKILNQSSFEFLSYYKKNISPIKFDLIHIDGGHSKKEVLNDLNIANKCSKKNSIIILDDIFNPSFPEVLEAYLKFKNKFQILFLSDQKIFLSKDKLFAKKVRRTILKGNLFKKKDIKFFNENTIYLTENNENIKFNFSQKFNLLKSLFYFKYHF